METLEKQGDGKKLIAGRVAPFLPTASVREAPVLAWSYKYLTLILYELLPIPVPYTSVLWPTANSPVPIQIAGTVGALACTTWQVEEIASPQKMHSFEGI